MCVLKLQQLVRLQLYVVVAAAATIEVSQFFFKSVRWRWRLGRSLVLLRRLGRASDDSMRERLMLAGGRQILTLSLGLGVFLAAVCLGLGFFPWALGLDSHAVTLYVTFLGIGSVAWVVIRSRFLHR